MLNKNWSEPERWQKRTSMDMPRPRVFPSLCDWLDPEVPAEWLARFLQLIHDTPSLNWLLLTKRPELWAERMRACIALAVASIPALEWFNGGPPPNVFMGVSVEDQARANERIPLLLEIPAVMRWLSVEPLLGPVDFRAVPGFNRSGSAGVEILRSFWVVVGGESGKEARECHAGWIRRVVEQCRGSKVPVFVKQIGSNPVDDLENAVRWGKVRDPKGGDPLEWPFELRVRELPALLTQ